MSFKTTRHSKRPCCGVVLIAALLFWLVSIAGADDTGADAPRPGQKDPYLNNRTMLRNDSIVVIQNRYGQDFLFGISPDKTVIDKNERKNNLNPISGIGTLRSYSDAIQQFVMDDEGNPYIISDHGSKISVTPADRLVADTGRAQEIKTEPNNVHMAYVTGNWDETGMTNCFVISRLAPGYRMHAQGVANIKYKDGAWEQPKLGEFKKINDKKLQFAGSPEIRFATGDLTGDGRKEIVIAYRTEPDNSYAFHLQVLRVVLDDKSTADWKYGLETIAEYDLDMKWNMHREYRSFSSFDVAVGDVDANGVAEILFAAIANDTQHADKAALEWRMLKLQGKQLVSMKAGPAIFSDATKDISHYLLRCVLADIDSDGRAEPVIMHTNAKKTAVLQACKYSEKTDQNKFVPMELYLGGRDVRAIDLGWGNFTGELVKGAVGDNAARVVYSIWTDDNQTRTRIMAWDAKAGRFKPITGNYWEYATNGPLPENNIYMAPLRMVIGDFRKMALTLGEPVHIVKENARNLLIVMQEPPKHLDYTLIENNKSGVLNLTRSDGFFTNFSDAKTTSSLVKTGQTSSSMAGVDLSSSVKVGHKSKLKGIGGHDVSVEVSAGVEKSSTVKKETLNESYKSSFSEIKSSTNNDDYVAYTRRTIDIWRYPILGVKSAVSKDHQVWHTVTVPAKDAAKRFAGMATPGFQPTWGNGNILTYPRTVGAIEDFRENMRIGGNNEFTVDKNKSSYTVGWTEETKKTETKTISTRQKSDTSVAMSLNADFMGFYVKSNTKVAMKSDELNDDTATSTNALNTKTSFTVENRGDFSDRLNNSNIYTVTPIVYETPGGVLKVGYTVDIPNNSLRWWQDRYASAPDAALNLPNLWVWKQQGGWVIDDNASRNPNARMIRGFFMSKAGLNLDPGVEETGPIDLYCRVYNLALKYGTEKDESAKSTLKNVKVKFEYARVKEGREDKKRTLIKETRIPQILPWNNDLEKPNWAYAAVSWDITNVPEGNYRIHVTINDDGDGESDIDELAHHGLDEEADNNRGWFDMAIAKPKKASAELLASLGEEPGEDFTMLPVVNLQPNAELFDLVVDEAEDEVSLTIDILNRGDDPALNVPVTLYGEDGTALGEMILPGVFPGESFPIVLTGDLDDIDEDYDEFSLVIGELLGEMDPASNSFTISRRSDDDDDLGGSGGCAAGAGMTLLLAVAAIAPLMRSRAKRE